MKQLKKKMNRFDAHLEDFANKILILESVQFHLDPKYSSNEGKKSESCVGEIRSRVRMHGMRNVLISEMTVQHSQALFF